MSAAETLAVKHVLALFDPFGGDTITLSPSTAPVSVMLSSALVCAAVLVKSKVAVADLISFTCVPLLPPTVMFLRIRSRYVPATPLSISMTPAAFSLIAVLELPI